MLTDDAGTYVMVVGPEQHGASAAPSGSAASPIAASSIAEGLNGTERVVESAGAFLNAGERVRPERPAGGAALMRKPDGSR